MGNYFQKEIECASRDEIVALQNEKLVKQVKYVYDNVAFGLRIPKLSPDGNGTILVFKYTFNTDEILSQAKAYSEEKGIKSGEQVYEITMKIDESSLADAAKIEFRDQLPKTAIGKVAYRQLEEEELHKNKE